MLERFSCSSGCGFCIYILFLQTKKKEEKIPKKEREIRTCLGSFRIVNFNLLKPFCCKCISVLGVIVKLCSTLSNYTSEREKEQRFFSLHSFSWSISCKQILMNAINTCSSIPVNYEFVPSSSRLVLLQWSSHPLPSQGPENQCWVCSCLWKTGFVFNFRVSVVESRSVTGQDTVSPW